MKGVCVSFAKWREILVLFTLVGLIIRIFLGYILLRRSLFNCLRCQWLCRAMAMVCFVSACLMMKWSSLDMISWGVRFVMLVFGYEKGEVCAMA